MLRLTRAVASLGRLITLVVANEHLARMSSVIADVLERRGVAVIGVDAREDTAVLGGDALDVDVPLAAVS